MTSARYTRATSATRSVAPRKHRRAVRFFLVFAVTFGLGCFFAVGASTNFAGYGVYLLAGLIGLIVAAASVSTQRNDTTPGKTSKFEDHWEDSPNWNNHIPGKRSYLIRHGIDG